MLCMYFVCYNFISKYILERMISGHTYPPTNDQTQSMILDIWYQRRDATGAFIDKQVLVSTLEFQPLVPLHVESECWEYFTCSTSQIQYVRCLEFNVIKWHTSSAMTFISRVPSEAWVTCWVSLYFDECNPTGLHGMLCGLWPMISYK